jgi:hypothetical protein
LPKRDLELQPAATVVAGKRDAGSLGAEPDELLVGARAGREPLCTDVERLEEVRLPGSVRPRDQDEPRLQCELEPFVAAEVSERDLADDQALLLYPASLIGMIR